MITKTNYTSIFILTVPTTGSYTLEIESDLDTFMYIIDPRLTGILVSNNGYNDDSGPGYNPSITRNLQKSTKYLVIVSGYNIQDSTHNGSVDFLLYSN